MNHPTDLPPGGVPATTNLLAQYGCGPVGHRRAVDRRSLQPACLRGPDRLQRLRPVRARLHDGELEICRAENASETRSLLSGIGLGSDEARRRAYFLLSDPRLMTYAALSRAGTISPILAFLNRTGVSADRLLAMAQLPARVTAEKEALIPGTSSVRIFGAALQETDIPNIGLTIGERSGIETFGMFGRLVRSAPTLGAALKSGVRYSRVLTSNRPLWLRPRGDRIELCMTVEDRFDPRDVAWQQDNQYGLGLMLGVVRLAAGPSWRPAEVHFQTDEAPGLRDAESLADSRVVFRQPETMVAIPRALLAARLPPLPAIDVPTDVVEDWKSSAPARDLAGSIRQAVETLSCGEHYPGVRQTADFVGMSVRTLQRGLAAAGTSHETLVAQTRFATAAAVLEQTDAKILDLALDLGYSDHANFTRAFRRWAGCSPREYRVSHGRRRRGGKGPLPRASGRPGPSP